MLRELFDARVGGALEEELRNDKAYIEVVGRTKDGLIGWRRSD